MIEASLEPFNILFALSAFAFGICLTGIVAAVFVRAAKNKGLMQVEHLENEHRLALSQLHHQNEESNRRVSVLHAEQAENQQQLRAAELEARKLDAELSAAKATLGGLSTLQERFDVTNSEVKNLREKNAQLETRLQEHTKQRAEELALLAEAKKSLTHEFEQTANRIFDAKQQQFSSTSKINLEQVLSPFKQQLGDFHKRVEDIYHKENSQRNQLVGQIAELQKQAQQISSDAVSLARALKGDNKAQGNWGEIVLERLLEQSGLEKGREYDTQVSLVNASGRRFQPDVIVRLPDNKDIIIDAKVSLINYEKYYSCETEQERDVAIKGHIESLRAHIRGLSIKEYEGLEGVRTLDFVFIFVPVEAAYLLAMQHSPTLFKEAYDKNIVLVSPSSLMVALRTVETIWRHEKQNKNAEKMAVSAGRLYDQFVMVGKSLEELGGCLNRAHDSYDKTWKRLSGGRGNLLRRMEDIRKLGAKTNKTLPESMSRELDINELDEPIDSVQLSYVTADGDDDDE